MGKWVKESEKNKAIIVLHEIYGLNKFIEQYCEELKSKGYDVFCPDMLGRECFSYTETDSAYEYFISELGFSEYKKIHSLVNSISAKYDRVYIIGFSVGATIAFLCSENTNCDGIVCMYGSRIRDYTNINPVCSTLLIFSDETSDGILECMSSKKHVTAIKYNTKHGFMDPYSEQFNQEFRNDADMLIDKILSKW